VTDNAATIATGIGLCALLLLVAFVAWHAYQTFGARKRALLAPTPSQLPRARPKPTVPRHPVVLAHGFLGFDSLGVPGMRHDYFRGVRGHLEALGCRVHVPRVSPIGSVRRRAEQLAEQLASIDAERVNVIAHSMGGLDARYAISKLGMDARVASLTTIGAPHRGTVLADASALVGDLLPFASLLARFAPQLEGLRDLTTEQMLEFNRSVPDADSVMYMSYVGAVPAQWADLHALLAPGHAYMHRMVGDNDGIVPAFSQRWGEVIGEVRADHWAQIGWSRGPDVRELYAALVRALAEREL
jgi:triacylglycerol lipase